jgi:CMP-N,N'-diacetyllegionaminic acid synthase
MRILTLIPARGGSKRLPGKNIKPLGGKPLINWTIEAANRIPEICDILVSTDDTEIAAIAKAAGAFVPWLRPSELATDKATSVDVALHALDWYENEFGSVDGLLLLQPTSPFRRTSTIEKGIELFKNHNFQPVLGVSKSESHPYWSFRQEGEYLIHFLTNMDSGMRSQDLPLIFTTNGVLYLVSPHDLRRNKSFSGEKTVPLHISSQKERLDIDSKWDFHLASLLCDYDY